jgi:hypothetical protein
MMGASRTHVLCFGVAAAMMATVPAKAGAFGGFDTVNGNVAHFETKIGSFKGIGSDAVPVQGKLDLSFNGTVLISGLDPKATLKMTGTVHKEYEIKDHTKQVYFGNGTLAITGKLRAIQFFGKDLKGRFEGIGVFRLFGEFDRNLETGFWWYEGSSEKHAWGTGGMQIITPNPEQPIAQPRVRVRSSGG